jgi:hydrogenase nickel incorporation protein HypB
VRQGVLSRNDAFASENRRRLAALDTVAFNLISSPGAGKTSLLEATIRRLAGEVPVAVIEGDLQTDRDAVRIAATGAPVHQINTGEGCHLDAHQVGHAMDHLPIPERGLLFIENVGNLVCPASFDLGETYRVVVLSVAEGDDKVEKYPVSFRSAHVLVINKVDLLEHVDFSIERCRETMSRLNPDAIVFEVSARTGAGLDDWCGWARSAAAKRR